MSNQEKKQALAEIKTLVDEHSITTAELLSVCTKNKAPLSFNQTLFKTVFAYLGGIFIISGICTLVALIWDDLASPARVLVTLGPGIIALVMAFTAIKDTRFSKAVTPLFLISAALQPTGLFVFLDEYGGDGDPHLAGLLIFFIMSAQMGTLFWKLKRPALLFFSLLFSVFFMATLMDWLDFEEETSALIIGLYGLAASYIAGRTAYGDFIPFTYFVSATVFAIGMFGLFGGEPPFDLLIVATAVGLLYVSIIVQSRSLLVAAVLFVLTALGYYTAEYFADFMSWPIALIVMGFVMLGVSGYAFKLSRKIKD